MYSISQELTLIRLIMINIVAVLSLRNIAITSHAGFIILTFYFIAGIFFFIPYIFVVSVMSSNHSQNGGIYLWAKEAFCSKIGFIILWLQWLYNLVWFPSICGFFASIMAYVIAPCFHLHPSVMISNHWYIVIASIIIFWTATIVSAFGLKISSNISMIGAMFGTLLPMMLIIIFAIFWIIYNDLPYFDFCFSNFMPNIFNTNHCGLFLTVTFSLIGIEMSAVHAKHVVNPKKNFPKSLIISGLIILLFLIFSNISIFIVSHDVTIDNKNIIMDFMDTFQYFFNKFNLSWISVIIALSLLVGSFSTISTWITGLAKSCTVAFYDQLIPKKFIQYNKYGAPYRILLFQAVIFSIFCLLYIFMPSVSNAYWFLNSLTAELAMIAYSVMFISAIKLCIKSKCYSKKLCFFGMKSIIISSCCGFCICFIAMIVGFIPDININISLIYFDLLLFFCIIIALIIPLLYLIILSKINTKHFVKV